MSYGLNEKALYRVTASTRMYVKQDSVTALVRSSVLALYGYIYSSSLSTHILKPGSVVSFE